jgi:photosystem II stability/assembly factor-like uncharacterized protein
LNKNWKIAFRVAACSLFVFCTAAFSSGQTWERLGPEGGNVISLATASNNTVYLGTADGHIFASPFSQDSAPHWELRGRASSRLDGVVQQLVTDARNPSRVFAAVWYQAPVAGGGGVFRSDDGARTWSPAGLSGEAVRAIEQSPSQPEILVAGTRTGIFRSNDSGANWQRISPAGDAELKNIDSLAIDPANPLVIYAGTYHLPWKTTDGGKTWSPIAAGMIDDSDVMTLRIDAANSTRIFASACSGIYRSENAAANWTKLQGIPYSSRRTQAIVQDRRDPRILYAGTTEGLWVTRDAGETWTRTTPREWVVNAIALVPGTTANQSTLLLGTEAQGILISNDAGLHFSPSNAGFSHHVVAALVGDPRDSQHFLARMDNPESTLLESRNAGKSWLPLTENRLAFIEKLFATDSGWWASINGGGLLHYDETARKWVRFRFVLVAPPTRHKTSTAQHPARAQSSIIVQKDPELSDVQSAGTHVYVATTNGLWSGELDKNMLYGPAPNTAKEAFHSVAISESGNELWAISNENLLHSTAAAKTWTLDSSHAVSSSLLSIHTLTTSDDTALLVATQRGFYKRSALPGSAWQLLQNGLPAAEPTAILSNTQFLVVAMRNGGIYLSRDAAKTWQRLDTAHEQSIFTSIVPDGHGGFFAASLAEGILHWSPASSTNP